MSAVPSESSVVRPSAEALRSRDELMTDPQLARDMDELVDRFLRGELERDRLTP